MKLSVPFALFLYLLSLLCLYALPIFCLYAMPIFCPLPMRYLTVGERSKIEGNRVQFSKTMYCVCDDI